ncbi:hypothetical protein A8C32_18735 [Flavivirga aquatica]|uniref:Adhesin domain-containing protein n=1 Tax=Flavivirga aquatica TaxID=1849968 RepID=A0A1E5T3V9_9FLAO|nr:hypothetical protein [Flavivirga aquatica]OEK06069.1 hypothetical protein A8C32_18735 [Flavivirga aquatica]
MKHSFCKTIIYSVFVLLSYYVLGQNKISKQVEKTYPLTNKGALYLDNKYGNVFINGWDKNTIKILVNIQVKGKDLDKAKDYLNRIKPNIIATNTQIIIKSEIVEKETSFFNKYVNKIDPFKNEKANTDIDYTVYLPKAVEVEVYNKYGDIIISDWNGKLKADVEHGDLRITDSITNSKIAIKYGKLRANTLYKTSVLAKGASLSISNVNTLKLDSNGSEISLDNINQLELNSNKDNLEINRINNVFGKIKYSKVILNNVMSKIHLDLNLAELRILKINTETPVFKVHQKTSEVYINISKSHFNFNAQLEQGVLRIPKTMYDIDSKILDEKNKIRHISANYGNKNKGILDLTGYKGIIILKEL